MTRVVNTAPRARHRDRSSIYTFTTTTKQTTQNTLNGTTVVDTNTSAAVLVPLPCTMDDWVTPGFSRRIQMGEIISNPMRSVEHTFSVSDSGLTLKATNVYPNTINIFSYTGLLGDRYGGVPVIPAPPISEIHRLKTLAQVGALSQVNQTGFKGIVAIAEGQQTLNMLLHPLTNVNALLQHVSQLRAANKNIRIDQYGDGSRSINGRRFRKYIPVKWGGPGRVVRSPKASIVIPAGKAISGTVLVNNLGLRPLMSDINAILHGIPNSHKEARHNYHQSERTDLTTNTEVPYTRGVASMAFNDKVEHKIHVRTSILAADKSSPTADFGFDLLSLPDAAWEMMRYSFVLDYFINIGQLLEALRGLYGGTILSCSTMTTVESILTRTVKSFNTNTAGYSVVSGFSGTLVSTRISKERVQGIDSDFVGLAFRPRKLVPTQVQNLLSLTVQLLSGKSGGLKNTFR